MPWLSPPTRKSLGAWAAELPDGIVRRAVCAEIERRGRRHRDGALYVPLYDKRHQITGYALLDLEDGALAEEFSWHLVEEGYARCSVEGRRKEFMHRLVAGCVPGDGLLVDHINRDRLDNRRANLRVVTRPAQQQNVPRQRGNSSRYRGVHLIKTTGMWGVQVRNYDTGGRKTHTFVNEDEAGEFARAWRLKHMPGAVD